MAITNPLTAHWDKVYHTKADTELGWYENQPEQTMRLVEACNLDKDARILNVGAGTTTLIDSLVKANYSNIIANDLSEVALEKLQARITSDFNYNLECIVDDLTQPKALQLIEPVDVWIDRAVLHFFTTTEEQQTYFDLVRKVVAKDGYVLIAVFETNGAPKCCGLELQRYNLEMLQNGLGDSFKLVDSFEYTYINPFGGERPYIYSLFQKAK